MKTTQYTIKRHLETIIDEVINQYKCLMLTGPRQVGKSTLLKYSLPKIKPFNFIDLDEPEKLKFAHNDPQEFLAKNKIPLCIDEVQKAPYLFAYIKSIVDKNNDKGQFVLTGSQRFELMKGANESFSTRMAIIEMQSLSQSEIYGRSNFAFIPKYEKFLERQCPPISQIEIFKRIINGSMPDVANGSIKNLDIFYDSYIKTTLFKDIRDDVVKIDDMQKFIRFISTLASYVGNTVNLTKISNLTQINRMTIDKWIRALEVMGIIFLIQPYANNMLKRVVKSPKLYFFDTGLVCCF
jgi:predicted AAA+ superfamily ATPase